MHRWKLFTLAIWVVAGLALSACVSKSEHEKIVSELQQVNQEKSAISDKLTEATQQKDDMSRKMAMLDERIAALQKENEALKAKEPVKKSAAAKPAAKKAPSKKKA